MKKLFAFFFITTMVLIAASCGSRSFIYSSSNSTENNIELGDFDFYARKMYAVKSKDGGREIVTEKDTLGRSEILLYEVQYLLIKDRKALYITTMPSKYYYDKEDSYIIDSYYPNAFYLNDFYFGKVTQNNGDMVLVFKHRKDRQEWDIRKKSNDELELVEVNLSKIKSEVPVSTLTIKTKNAFQNSFIFKKIPVPFSFGFKRPYTSSDYDKNNQLKINNSKTLQKNTLRTNALYLTFKNDKKTKIKQVLIRFNDTLTLSFKCGRVRFYEGF